MKQPRSTPPSRPRKILFGAAAVTVSVLVTLLCLEVFLRVFYPGIGSLRSIITQAPGGDSRAYVLRPGAQAVFEGLHQRLDEPARWRINAGGIRSDRPVPPKSGKFRVATFGDSETFGWSVSIEHTFQRRMERIDPDVEVINFGTPGYNAENIADQMADFLPGLKADFIFYMFHKNDLEPPLTFTPWLTSSRLYLLYRKSEARIVRYLFPEGAGNRQTPERLNRLSGQFDRMKALSRRENVPLVIGFMDWRFNTMFNASVRGNCTPPENPSACARAEHPGAWVGLLNIDRIRQSMNRIDGHMPPPAHQQIAELLCRVISAGRAGRCVPPYWRRTP